MLKETINNTLQELIKLNDDCIINIDSEKIENDFYNNQQILNLNISMTSKFDKQDNINISFQIFNYTLRHCDIKQAVLITEKYNQNIDDIMKKGFTMSIGNFPNLPLVKSNIANTNQVFTIDNIPENNGITFNYVLSYFKVFWGLALSISYSLMTEDIEKKKKSFQQ